MNIPKSENALLIRTDFSNQSAWEKLTAAVNEPADPLIFNMEILDERDRRAVTSLGWMNALRQKEERLSTIVDVILLIGLVIVALLALLAYGQYWPSQWQARVPRTNTRGVERAVGRPSRVSTNIDGSVMWDYTHWWSGTAKVYFTTNGDYYRIFTEW